MLGNGRTDLYCFDGVTRKGHICGKLKKKVWITIGDVVLVGLRDFEVEKCDIMHKYLPEEVRQLIAFNEIPENIKVNEQNDVKGSDIVFMDGSGSDSDAENVKKSNYVSSQ